MPQFINPDVFKAKIHELIAALEPQYQAARQAWRDIAVKMNALQAEHTQKENEWKMAEQRKAALMDLLTVIEEIVRR